MDGNHSLPADISHLICGAVAQAPLIINIILGLPANICVMWLILAGPRNKASAIFSLNQAICEVVISMLNVIWLIVSNTIRSNLAIFPYLLDLWRFTSGIVFSGQPLFVSCVCLEHYLAVVRPVTFLKYKPLRYRLALSLISWMTLLACCIILMWLPNTAFEYVSFAMALIWFLVLLFCCVETLRALVRPRPGKGNQQVSGMSSAKLKALRIILIITISVFMTYLPYVISVISYVHVSKEDSSKLFCASTFFAVVAGFLPPILYIHTTGKLQHCIKVTK